VGTKADAPKMEQLNLAFATGAVQEDRQVCFPFSQSLVLLRYSLEHKYPGKQLSKEATKKELAAQASEKPKPPHKVRRSSSSEAQLKDSFVSDNVKYYGQSLCSKSNRYLKHFLVGDGMNGYLRSNGERDMTGFRIVAIVVVTPRNVIFVRYGGFYRIWW
jgi:hypothetical protein